MTRIHSPFATLSLAVAVATAGIGLVAPASARGTDPGDAQASELAEAGEAEAKSGQVSARPSTDLERSLLERARAYWDARLAHSTEVYDFYPPRKAREKEWVPREFVGMGFASYDIQRVVVDVNGERGFVVVAPVPVLSKKLETQLRGFDYQSHLNAPVGEEWIHVDGEWWKKPQYGGLSRFTKHSREARTQQILAEKEAKAAAQDEGGEDNQASSE